jgi:hypothetical protein
MPATPTSASAKSSSAIFSERASTVSFYRTRMRSRIATGLATVLLAALLLAGLVAALEGVAALAGITPLAEDAGYVARSPTGAVSSAGTTHASAAILRAWPGSRVP